MLSSLNSGILGILPEFGIAKSQNDMLFGNSGFDQLVGNAVVLNPDSAVFDVDAKHAAVNPFFFFPADVNQFIMIPFIIENSLCLRFCEQGCE